MTDDLSRDRLTRNEQVIRERNMRKKDGLKKFFRSSRAVTKAPIDFVCECSRLDCKQRIKLSIDEYEKIHKRQDRFIITAGHGTPSVENIINKTNGYEIVEKHLLSPAI